jgi:hypothetical protein
MKYAILTKQGAPIGTAIGKAEVLDKCGITFTHKEITGSDPQYPSHLRVIANKRYTIGSWFEQSYVLKCTESAWSDCGFTYYDALRRAVKDMFEKCRKEFLIVPL